MKYRSWPILILAFGILLALIAVTGLGALRRSKQIQRQILAMNEAQLRSETLFSDLRSEIHVMGVLIRDYLLEPSGIAAERYDARLRGVRSSMFAHIDDLAAVLGDEDEARMERLRKELDGYWQAMAPMFVWTPRQKTALSWLFLRKQVLPRRDAALGIAAEIQQLMHEELDRRRRLIEEKQRELPLYVTRSLAVTILLGSIVAAASVMRISRLERRSEAQRGRAEAAELEMRRLSLQLVNTQEQERKSISRELHDEVGQTLTALRMELHSLQELRASPGDEFGTHLEDGKRLAEQALRSVRHIAMGLRPSMLDDLGLAAALQWQAREFSRHNATPVTVQVDGAVNGIPEHHRTCIYRVVQEALTNCARHAQAQEIQVAVHGDSERLSVTVQDNGVGFDVAASRGRGLGLVGIEERVRELGGEVSIVSQHGKGTVVHAKIPAPGDVA